MVEAHRDSCPYYSGKTHRCHPPEHYTPVNVFAPVKGDLDGLPGYICARDVATLHYPFYSILNACTGSVEAARRAGMIPAIHAAAASIAMVPAIKLGSALVIS
jgi:hypothetical protein